jgi:hypothetical protein
VLLPEVNFSLTDLATGLELTADVKSTKLDSVQAISLFKEVRKPLSKYSQINWIYLVVKQQDDRVWILREHPGQGIVFVKNREE